VIDQDLQDGADGGRDRPGRHVREKSAFLGKIEFSGRDRSAGGDWWGREKVRGRAHDRPVLIAEHFE
jgi:hypothetical protein